MGKRAVFFYAELAPYILKCMEALSLEFSEVHVVAYPVNKEAPFQFNQSRSQIRFYDRNSLDNGGLLQLLRNVRPDIIVASGWIDKGYLKAIGLYSQPATKVVAIDNQITRDLKGKISRLRASSLYRPLFDYAWVPGPPQVAYCSEIGFRRSQIKQFFYTADYNRFKNLDQNPNRDQFPKRFVFVGRYLDFKGITELCQAFISLNEHDWELHCIGTGDLFDGRIEHPAIIHHGFVQPADLDKFVSEGGVFVLPSWKEPWGVVVHEFTSAGFPLICSTAVGASSVFLKEGANGFAFESRNVNSLREAMNKVIAKSNTELFEMGESSKVLAAEYSIEKWVKTAKELIEHE